MAIKYGTDSVSVINFNGNDVKKVVKDGTTVWCKPYSYTRGTLPTGCSDLIIRGGVSEEPTRNYADLPIINQSTSLTVYHGDSIYWAAEASDGYVCSVTHGSTNPYTVTGDITNGVTASGLTVTRAYTASISGNTNSTYGVWVALSTSTTINANLVSGSSYTLKATYGTTVYAFVKLRSATSTSYISSDWVLVSGTAGAKNAVYRIGSHYMVSDYNFGTLNARTLSLSAIWSSTSEDFIINCTGMNVSTTLHIYFYCETSTTDYDTNITSSMSFGNAIVNITSEAYNQEGVYLPYAAEAVAYYASITASATNYNSKTIII